MNACDLITCTMEPLETIPDPDTPREHKKVLRSFDRRNHEEIAFQKAKGEVLSLQLNIKRAALKYNVPISALEDNIQIQRFSQFVKARSKETAHQRKMRVARERWKRLSQRKELEEKIALAIERGEEVPESLLQHRSRKKSSFRCRLKQLLSQRKRNRENRTARLLYTKECWTEALQISREAAALRNDEPSRAEVKANEQRLARLERKLKIELERERIAEGLIAVPPPQTPFGEVIVQKSNVGTVDNRERQARLNRLRAIDPSMVTKGIW